MKTNSKLKDVVDEKEIWKRHQSNSQGSLELDSLKFFIWFDFVMELFFYQNCKSWMFDSNVCDDVGILPFVPKNFLTLPWLKSWQWASGCDKMPQKEFLVDPNVADSNEK